MKYYAIIHKPSGKHMPEYGSRKGRGGFTNDEPVPADFLPPRLFTTKRAAKCALTYWLQGATSVRVHYNGEDYDESWHTEFIRDRVPEDMEVVEMEVKRC